MKLVRYQFMGRDDLEEYLITEAEFQVALAAWKSGEDFLCHRLQALLTRPKLPTTTPKRFQLFDMFSDPKRPWKEFALLADGKFHEFDHSQTKTYEALIADDEVAQRLVRFEDLSASAPELTKLSAPDDHATRLQGPR